MTPRELTFAGIPSDIAPQILIIEGALPPWLRGTFIRNGPGRYAFAQPVEFRHWFDGMAFLQRFEFDDAHVSYSGRFLQTRSYEAALQGRAVYQSFGTPAAPSFASRLAGLALANVTDNTNVNVARYGDSSVALTEIGLPRCFDPQTLETGDLWPFSDGLGSGPTTAHPLLRGDSWINYTLKLGMRSEYIVWRLGRNGTRTPIARIPSRRPAYVHSIGMSERRVVLIEYPFRVTPVAMLLSGKPFIDNFSWDGGETLIHLIDPNGIEPVMTCSAEPFFSFHHVSAFDDGDAVAIDLVAYDDASIVPSLYLQNVRERRPATNGLSLRRYRAPLSGGDASRTTLSAAIIELPRVNAATARPRYVYAPRFCDGTRFTDAVVRIDNESAAELLWERPDESPGEAVFVPRPGARNENDGAVLFVALNVADQSSSLVVLDGATFTERARARVAAPLPLGFHGQFWFRH